MRRARDAAGGKPRATTAAVSSLLPSSTRMISCGVSPSVAAISEKLGEVLRFVSRRHDDRDHRFVQVIARAQRAGPPAASSEAEPPSAPRPI
jgi:hypothetical protein